MAQVRSYDWIPKGTNGYRKLKKESIQFNGATESETAYAYDQYGCDAPALIVD